MLIRPANLYVHVEKEKCNLCGQPIDRCICCPECGHDCLLERGEIYCSVCLPEPNRGRVTKKGS